MTKRLAATILMILFFALLFCACFTQPFKEVSVNLNIPSGDLNVSDNESSSVSMRKLYVSGAVQNDGYITIPQLCDYKMVLEITGVTDFSVIPNNLTMPVFASTESLIIDFSCSGVDFHSVNVNGAFVILRQSVEGVDDGVINKLADYIGSYGKITNRNSLKLALGEDYAENYYKFYIDVNDYA